MNERANKARPSFEELLRRAGKCLRGERARHVMVCVAGTMLLCAVFLVAIAPMRYDISIGEVPNVTIAANKDVVDEVTTAQKREEAARAVAATYYYKEGVDDEVLSLLDQVFAEFDAAMEYASTLENRSPTRRYAPEELDYARDILETVSLRDYQITTLLNSTPAAVDDLCDVLYAAVSNKLSDYITEGKETDAIGGIMEIVGFKVDTSLLQNIVQPTLKAVVRPNMVVDQAATETARQEARDSVEAVVYKQGQNILVKGEGRVQNYQYEMLRSLGLLSDGVLDVTMYLGGALLVILTVCVLLILLRALSPSLFKNTRKLLLLFTALFTTLLAGVLCRALNVYLAPVTLGAMLLTGMLGMRVGAASGVAMALLVSALSAGGSDAYTASMVNMLSGSLVSGTVACLILRSKSSRLRLLLTGAVVAALNLIAMLAVSLMTESDLNSVFGGAAWFMGSGMLASVLCIALQPVLETVFNLATPSKLMELSNPNQPLLRRLLLEASGTYHHSIIVANLAEAAAEAVGANPLLARVGGYYHDVGKLKRPLYFKENQMGEDNAHDHTDPQVSAAILTAHVRDGVALARAYRLPQEVQEIIAQHHGDTAVMFFYHKALQMAQGKPVDVSAFRYDGPPPTTREGAIVMMADTVEAAVRSMQNPTPERIEEFIVRLVRGKLEDGQLANCPLTLKDIDAVCTAFSTVLIGVFHERIEYPGQETESDVKKLPRKPARAEDAKAPKKPARKPLSVMAGKGDKRRQPPPPPDPKPAPMPEISIDLMPPVPVPTVDPREFGDPEALTEVPLPDNGEPVQVDTLIASSEEPDHEINT